MEIEITATECCDLIEKLNQTLQRCTDNPTKSPQYLAVESTIITLCDKLKNCKIVK